MLHTTRTSEEFKRCSQALKTDLTLPGTASFKADTFKLSGREVDAWQWKI